MNAQRSVLTIVTMMAVGLLANGAAITAHHASAPFYDSTKSVEAQGTVTKFVFRNPHGFLFIESTNDKGQKIEWQIELGAPVSLARTGWTPETLKPGMVVKVVGQPSRAEGTHGICCARITTPEGTPIAPGARVQEETQK